MINLKNERTQEDVLKLFFPTAENVRV
jgi:hypothetical protein